jgi:hypothetical protein
LGQSPTSLDLGQNLLENLLRDRLLVDVLNAEGLEVLAEICCCEGRQEDEDGLGDF